MLETLSLPYMYILKGNYWYLSRAAGIVAYLLLWSALFSGLLLKTKMLNPIRLSPLLPGLHQLSTSWSLYFTVFHVLLLRYDAYIKFSFGDLFVPFAATYQTSYLSIGILSFYGLVLVIVGAYLFKSKAFRFWHILTYPAFLLAWWHGFKLGTDTQVVWMQAIYWSTGGLTGYIIIYRILGKFFELKTKRRLNSADTAGGRRPTPGASTG